MRKELTFKIIEGSMDKLSESITKLKAEGWIIVEIGSDYSEILDRNNYWVALEKMTQ